MTELNLNAQQDRHLSASDTLRFRVFLVFLAVTGFLSWVPVQARASYTWDGHVWTLLLLTYLAISLCLCGGKIQILGIGFAVGISIWAVGHALVYGVFGFLVLDRSILALVFLLPAHLLMLIASVASMARRFTQSPVMFLFGCVASYVILNAIIPSFLK